MTATVLATAANRIAADHAAVVTRFHSLTASAAGGTISEGDAAVQARILGASRARFEGEMDSVLRAASAVLAGILMLQIIAQAEALA